MADQTAINESIAMMFYFMNARTNAGWEDPEAYRVYGREYDKWCDIYNTLFNTIYRSF